MTLTYDDDDATQLVDDDIGTDASFKETVESIEPDPDDFDDIFGSPKHKVKPVKLSKSPKQSKSSDDQTYTKQADESISQPRHSHKRQSAAVALPSNLGKLIGSGLLITIVAVASMFAIMYGVSLARAHGALSQAQEQVVDAKASLAKSFDTLKTATTEYNTALDASGVDVASYTQAKTQANDDVAAAQQALANLDDAINAASEYTWHSANGWSIKKLNDTASGWRKLASTGESMSQSAHDTTNDLSRIREDLESRIKANVVQPVKQNASGWRKLASTGESMSQSAHDTTNDLSRIREDLESRIKANVVQPVKQNNDNDKNKDKQPDNDTDQSTGASAGSSRIREDLESRIKANVVQPVKQNNDNDKNKDKQPDNDTDQSTGASAGSTTGSTGTMNDATNNQYAQNMQNTTMNHNNGSYQQPQQSQQQRQVQSQTQAPPDGTEVIVEQKSDGGFVLSQENKDGAAWLNKLKAGDIVILNGKEYVPPDGTEVIVEQKSDGGFVLSQENKDGAAWLNKLKAGDIVILNGKEYVLSGDVLHGSTLAEANASAR